MHGLVLVRSSSKRLKKKCFLPFGKMNVLEHIIERCFYYKIKPIICTTSNKNDDPIVSIAKKKKILFFRGSEKNKIKRISDCCKKFDISYFHTIDADDPFFCGIEIKKSMNELLKSNYDIIEPSISSSNGAASVGYSVKSLTFHLLSEKINKNTNTEMMWGFYNRFKDLKIKKLKKLPFSIKARLTLDYHEDYILLESIRLLLGNFASRKKIYFLLKKNTDLLKINMFRNQEWKMRQKQQLKKIIRKK